METEILANLIDQKYEVLSQLRKLAHRQIGLVEQGDTTKLLNLLAVKQTVLQQLHDLERKLDPFRAQDPESRRWKSLQHRQQTRDTATRCEALLKEVMQLEKQCETDLIQRRDAAASQLQTMHSISHATHAYQQQGPTHRQLDVSSER